MKPGARRKYLCDECKTLAVPKKAHECPGCKQLKAKDWYQANKEKFVKWRKKWRAENPERQKELAAKHRDIYRERHPERKKASDKKYYLSNLELYRRYRKIWRLENRDRWLASRRSLYSRKNYGEYSEAHLTMLLLKQELKREKKDGKPEK